MPITPITDTGTTDTGAPARHVGLGLPPFAYRGLRALCHGVNRAYFRVSVEGADVVPATGAVILAPVHRSNIDFLVVSEVSKRKLFYMAKDSLWRAPRFGTFLESIGAFPVHREGADRLALDRSQDVLERGEALILFPEGTRRSGPVVEELHEGAAFLAARTGAPIVPIGIGGSDLAMPKGKILPKPLTIQVVIGPAIPPPPRTGGGRVSRSSVHAATDDLVAKLQAVYDEARAKTGRY